jgi:hypothetical protein
VKVPISCAVCKWSHKNSANVERTNWWFCFKPGMNLAIISRAKGKLPKPPKWCPLRRKP